MISRKKILLLALLFSHFFVYFWNVNKSHAFQWSRKMQAQIKTKTNSKNMTKLVKSSDQKVNFSIVSNGF